MWQEEEVTETEIEIETQQTSSRSRATSQRKSPLIKHRQMIGRESDAAVAEEPQQKKCAVWPLDAQLAATIRAAVGRAASEHEVSSQKESERRRSELFCSGRERN